MRTFELPARYRDDWRAPFHDRVCRHLRPGMTVLDIGAGATPSISVAGRPPGCLYVGLDLSREELAKAPAGAYDETWSVDAATRLPELVERFDLIVSWQVLEHVRSLEAVLDNSRAYLRPGGALVALFSGSFSFPAAANRVVPLRVSRALMHRLLGRPPETVFPAYYDHTWYSAVARYLADWQTAEVVPLYRGAGYFSFSAAMQRLYIRYEDWALLSGHRNLATHYLVHAIRDGKRE